MSTASTEKAASPKPEKAKMAGTTAGASLASRGERLIAAIIDAVVMCVVLGPIMLVMGFMGIWGQSMLVNQIVSTIIAGAVFVGVNYVFLKEGQTVGKKVLNLRIVGRDNQLKSVDELLLKRYAPVWGVGLIPYIGGLLALINVLCIFRDNRACIHDDIAETKVVNA